LILKLFSNHQMDDTPVEFVNKILKNKLFTELIDFDNHLDNINFDWRNIKLNEKLNDSLTSIDTLTSKKDA
jgi:hypothetical protein